ncbi:hypothetical protein XAC3810_660160 [Xanthomonas citri pv. citri]|uniref:Uncharacterized protein n=1 Tax=Xanthomonas citri pv. citri TaxID=611301 RepID=A0A0U5FIK1_XANCI|nr:hypothetical protein XAC9322_630133 [Xanthomonas citri pv. citri]CEE36478.1 hypothetical protein XAC3824_820184 [Xanthomonas citri pv. citri]CEE37514.1 hypothetical protein XAC1083_650160 [Xanthomonas citri pv. citri]CEE46060.1 hypothetical protein XAC3810_660160 [Xanthomonas citri pv. citri]CEE47118.1 hypothetical protein XAC902_970162 [Xanthomonas citri pv. citri]
MRRNINSKLNLIYSGQENVLRRSVTIDCNGGKVQCAAAAGSRTDAQGFACRRPFLRSPSRASWRSTPVFLACNTASGCSRAT